MLVAGERRVDAALRPTASPSLLRALRANFAALDATFVFARGPRPGMQAAGYATRSHQTLDAVLRLSNEEIDRLTHDGRVTEWEATVGSAAAIVALLVGFWCIHRRALRGRRRLAEALVKLERAQADRLRLLARTVEVAEAERRRVAAELHDGPIQRLTATAFTLDLLVGRLARGEHDRAAELAHDVREQVSAQMVALRGLMSQLRPPVLEEGGVTAAISDLAPRVVSSEIDLAVHDRTARERFTPEVETLLFRVAHEALANVERHSQARRVDVWLERWKGSVRLTVADDGVGFTPDVDDGGGTLGLVGVREHVESMGGEVRVLSGEGNGTRVKVTIPARAIEEAEQRVVA